jgi:hypothetical protein
VVLSLGKLTSSVYTYVPFVPVYLNDVFLYTSLYLRRKRRWKRQRRRRRRRR